MYRLSRSPRYTWAWEIGSERCTGSHVAMKVETAAWCC